MDSATVGTLSSPLNSAKEVLGRLPLDSTWDDVMYHLWVREKLDRSVQEANEGKLIDHDELFEELLETESPENIQ